MRNDVERVSGINSHMRMTESHWRRYVSEQHHFKSVAMRGLFTEGADLDMLLVTANCAFHRNDTSIEKRFIDNVLENQLKRSFEEAVTDRIKAQMAKDVKEFEDLFWGLPKYIQLKTELLFREQPYTEFY